ncbi:hypothetical protein L9F63_009377, partial [Diploptera punctata]
RKLRQKPADQKGHTGEETKTPNNKVSQKDDNYTHPKPKHTAKNATIDKTFEIEINNRFISLQKPPDIPPTIVVDASDINAYKLRHIAAVATKLHSTTIDVFISEMVEVNDGLETKKFDRGSILCINVLRTLYSSERQIYYGIYLNGLNFQEACLLFLSSLRLNFKTHRYKFVLLNVNFSQTVESK